MQSGIPDDTTTLDTAFDVTAVSQWLFDVHPLLHQSAWQSALRVGAVDVVDVLMTYLYESIASLLRDKPRAASQHHRRSNHIAAWSKAKWQASAWRVQVTRASLYSRRPAPYPVVFWPWQRAHLKAHIPVAAVLAQMGIESCFVASTPACFFDLTQQGIRAVYASAVWRQAMVAARSQAAHAISVLDRSPEVAFPPLPGAAVAPDEIAQALRAPLKKLLAMVHENVALVDGMLDSMTPHVLVVGNDITLVGRCGCVQSGAHGVRTACLMHGNIPGHPLQGRTVADRTLVYGDTNRRTLENLGAEPSRIVVTGAPYLDNKPRQLGKPHTVIVRRLGLDSDQPLVMVLTSGPGHSVSMSHHIKVIETVMRLSAEFKQVAFVAKLHRKDKTAYYSEVQTRVPGQRLHVVADRAHGFPTKIFDWLQGCRLVLTGASTVALEAMLMDVPVITMDFVGELKGYDFIDAGATTHIHTAEELRSALQRLVFDPAAHAQALERASAYIQDSFHTLDGQASHRAAQVIYDLMEGK